MSTRTEGPAPEITAAWCSARSVSTRCIEAAYADACSTLGRDVEVELPGGVHLRGTAMDVDAEGRLVVAGPDGETVVGAGDVVHVRPDSLT